MFAIIRLRIPVSLDRGVSTVIHRDLKPSNILLGERSGNSVGPVYLIDFGSVQTVLATEGGTRTVVGTYGYMPQEQFGGRTVPASDLYSLGATLIYLVTGTHPADLPQKDFCIQFEQATNLSPSLTNWLKWMTQISLEKRLSSASEALSVLQKDFSREIIPLELTRGDWYWDKNNWTLKQQQQQDKPAGSKVQLTKNEDALDITIPPVGFQSSMVFMGFFAIFWNLFILVWTIGALSAPFPGNIPFALFSLPFWGVGFSMIYGIVYGLFGGVSIHIDQQQISLNHQLGKWKIPRCRSVSRESINKLVYTPQYFTKDSDGNKTQVPAKLVIWAGVEKFEFSVNNFPIKSVGELEWLARELSQWLNMPIITE